MKKHIISSLTVAALLLSLAACGKQDAGVTTDTKGEPNTTYTGTVSAISTQSITVATDAGEITIPLTEATAFSGEFGMGGQMPGNMGQIPDGMGETPSDMGEIPSDMGETPSDMGEIPSDMGEIPSDMGEIPSDMGEIPSDMGDAEPPEKPDGEAFDAADQGETRPELPEGEDDQNGMTAIDPVPDQPQNATIAVVYIGAAVTVETDDNGAAATVTVSGGDMPEMQQPGDIGQMPGETIAGTDGNEATE